MGRMLKGVLAAIVAVVATLASGAPAGATFTDVPSGHWARAAIRYVAEDRAWMRDFGTDEFRPDAYLHRRHLARATVRAFAPSENPDPDITFSDLPADDPFYRFANVAVKLRWMTARGGRFRPDDRVPKPDLDRALVRALHLKREVAGLNRIHTRDGRRLAHPAGFAYLVLALELGLHYNHPTSAERNELLPITKVRRADGAYALYRAALARGTYRITSLERYREVELPALTDRRRRVVEWALGHAGYPYVWAGEWHRRTPSGYCCGAQAQGGFDCSGYAWWVLRRPGDGWDNTAYRPYRGWSLPQRSSRYMAKGTRDRLSYRESKPTDLMFFDSDGGRGWDGVDHAGIYLGRGWMIDSSSSRDGVSITWVKQGWYRDHFVWSRRVVPD